MSTHFNSLIQTGVPVSRQNQNLSFKSTSRGKKWHFTDICTRSNYLNAANVGLELIMIDAMSNVLYSSSEFEDFKTPKECDTFRIIYGQRGGFKLVIDVSHITYQS